MGLQLKTIARLSKPGRYHHERGLYLQVSRSGTKSWLYRYQHEGKEHMMGLGALRFVPLAEAEILLNALELQLKKERIDPLAARRARRARESGDDAGRKTFDECVAAYLATHLASWKSARHAQQWENTLRDYAAPIIGGMSVAAITRADVLRVLAPIWKEKTVTAGRLRGRIETVLSWATANGFRSGDNPAIWSSLRHDLADPTKITTTKHHAAVPFPEMPAFYADLAERPGIAARALLFTILTAARTSETTGAVWSEIDLDAGVWEIPKERMKMGREHRVPLTSEALALLDALPREEGNPFVFIGGKGGLSNAAMASVMQRMGRPETIHGFRATFKTWCSDVTSFPPHLVEGCLAHVNRDKVESAYNRGDLFKKRQKIMQAWASFVSTPAPASNVVPLKAKA